MPCEIVKDHLCPVRSNVGNYLCPVRSLKTICVLLEVTLGTICALWDRWDYPCLSVLVLCWEIFVLENGEYI